MPGRKFFAGTSYRYGFNGKENDNDVKGEGNQQDYGMRIYDSRLGKFLSEDPITKEYPELTPYQFASNRPIDGIDRDGLEWSPSGRNGFLQLATDATAVMHYSGDPVMLRKQVEQAPERQRVETAKAIMESVRIKGRQQKAAIGQYRQPSIAQQAKNNASQKAYDATVVPANHWTRNKHLNKLSANVVEPMVEMGIGDGIGKIVSKGVSLIVEANANRLSTTIFRTINEGEAKSIFSNNNNFSFGPNGSTMKQFWLSEDAYNKYVSANPAFSNGFILEVKVPKSLIGKDKVLNTSVQVDDYLFPVGSTNSATVQGQSALDKLNKSTKNIKIKKE